MFIKELDLGLDYEKLGLKAPSTAPRFTGFILKNYSEYPLTKLRPAVLVLPGGAYMATSEREAGPVAREFLSDGACAFVLHYSHAPEVYFPTELLQALSAIRVIRENAEEWSIDPNKIAVIGFSAGGHLAASTGTLWNHDIVKKYGFVGESHKPNGMVLSYPVITSGEKSHRDSFKFLLGDNYNSENLELVSLEKQVSPNTPKTFIWHTYEDNCVPVENSMMFANALIANKVPVELHIYPHGVHGIAMSNEVSCPNELIQIKNQSWVTFAKEWLKEL